MGTLTDSPTASKVRKSRGRTVPRTPRPESDRIVGDASKGEIEVRYDDHSHRVLDEICAANAHVHLEMMGDCEYALIVETSKQRGCYFIHASNGRAHVRAVESWRDSINRRSEAARRRENRKALAR